MSSSLMSKVSLSHDLLSMNKTTFVSAKEESYVGGEENTEGSEKSIHYNNFIEKKTDSMITESRCRISPMRINHRAQIDVLDMREGESGLYEHLLIYEEQYSKFVILKALQSSNPREIAIELVEIVTTIGAPRIIQSGNGRDHAEQVVREIRTLLRDFCVVHGDAAKNNDARRDFRAMLRTWTKKNPGKSWHEGLKNVQVVENTTANPRHGTAPSQLFFGRNICDDLRRTIGVKGSSGNAVTEVEPFSTTSRERGDSSADSNSTDAIPISIGSADDDVAEENEKDSRDLESREETERVVSPRADGIAKNSNFVSLKGELPIVTENETGFLTEAEERVNSDKYNFRCKICQKQYVKLGHLRNHMKSHTRVGIHECTICCKSFRLSSLYERHMQRFHEDKSTSAVKSQRLEKDNESNDDGNERVVEEEELASKRRRRVEENSETINFAPRERKKSPSSSSTTQKSSKRGTNSVSRRKHDDSSKLNGNPLLECTYCKQRFNFPSVLKRHMRSHTNERPYVCQICGKSFKQHGHLSQHSLTHTDYRSFQCTICAVKFDSLDSLKLHSESHKNDEDAPNRPRDTYRLFECDSCKKVFTTKSVLERHIFTHSQERQFGCKVCGKRFKQAGHVKSHMLVHTGERKFACTICSKRFSLSNSLKKHMYVHNGEKPHQCDVCGARFLEKRNLNGHLMTHTNERPFGCKICGKRYTLADTLRRHVSAAHEHGRTYQCEICAKMFKQLAHLSVHKKVHNDERPFQCHLCEKNFKHKNVLKSHLAIHANVRPFECDVCKATFVRKTNLQTHIASAHMNERPYVCTICNKRFKQISHLNGHIVVHSNSMPYQCDFCDRRCNRLDNLKKHMRLHTKNKE